MKKLLCLIIAVFCLCSCTELTEMVVPEEAGQKTTTTENKENPVKTEKKKISDKTEEQVQIDFSKKKLSTNAGAYGISYEIEGETVKVTGNLRNNSASYVMTDFGCGDQYKNVAEITNNHFELISELPSSYDTLKLNIYVGNDRYGNYNSIIYDVITAEHVNGEWIFEDPAVLDNNISEYKKSKKIKECLEETTVIEKNNPEIIKLANELATGCSNDYEILLNIHDWIADNIYYDKDIFNSGAYKTADMSSSVVLRDKKTVCEGYSTLFAALARANNIPCILVAGFALGDGSEKEWNSSNLGIKEANHTWNEAYVDGRWIIIDVTWDTEHKYENGQWISGKKINHTYFDSDLKFFSSNHKIFNYK